MGGRGCLYKSDSLWFILTVNEMNSTAILSQFCDEEFYLQLKNTLNLMELLFRG